MYTKIKICFVALFAAFFILLQPVSTGEFRPSHDTRMIRAELAYEAALERSETAYSARLEVAARTQHQPKKRASRSLTRPNPGGLECIKQKESGGNYQSNGSYHGGYQYSISTWNNYGGYTNPADAPSSVQDQRAREDYAKGPAQIHQNWPQASYQCGS